MELNLKHMKKSWKRLRLMIFKHNLKNKNNYIDLTGIAQLVERLTVDQLVACSIQVARMFLILRLKKRGKISIFIILRFNLKKNN